jgi:hypothetical protein
MQHYDGCNIINIYLSIDTCNIMNICYSMVCGLHSEGACEDYRLTTV